MRRATTNALNGLLAWVLLGGTPAVATTLTVTTTADAGPGSLRDALANAQSADTIAFAVEGTIDLASGPLFIRQNVTITGPGQAMLAISAGHAFRVFVVGDMGPVTAAISGLTIRDGSGDSGGGILNRGMLTLTDVILIGNSATSGGAIHNAGTLELVDSIITGNTSVVYGGGIYNAFGRVLTMNRAMVSANVALVGGGMTNDGGNVRIANSTFASNSAVQMGTGSGGAIYNGGLGGPLDITSSTFAYNTTDGQGGAIYAANGSLTVVNSTITGNRSTCSTGGCSGGGGIVNHTARASIVHSTLYANVTVPFDHLGDNLLSYYGMTTVKNSILGGSRRNCRSYHPSNIISAGYNLSDDDTCGTHLTAAGDLNGAPAGLSASGLRDNGGLTQTIALLATSPAVDAVPLAGCVSPTDTPVYDQRGVSRPQAGACDMGAFEVAYVATTLDLAPLAPSSFVAGWMGPLLLSATLTRSDDGVPIAGAAVSFLVDGVGAGTSTTDATGIASLAYDPSSLMVGGHPVQAVAARQTPGDDSLEQAISGVHDLQVTPSPYDAQVQQPLRADGTSVFKANRGVVPVKFTLSYNGAPTCDLTQAMVLITRVSGSAPGPVNESDYVLAADDGAQFRIESCQYVYNLGTSSLGPGTYVVSIVIGSTIAGRATFGLQ